MLKPNPLYLKELYETIKKAPYPKHMNMILASIDYDKSVVELDLKECHLQPFGIVHGGVIATLIDTATFWAGFMRIPEDAGLVNVDLKLNYLRPVVTGLLRAEGVAIKPGKTLSYTEARIFDADGSLVSHGTSTLMTLPGKGLRSHHAKFLSE